MKCSSYRGQKACITNPRLLIEDKWNYLQKKVYQGRIAARGWFFQVGLVYECDLT